MNALPDPRPALDAGAEAVVCWANGSGVAEGLGIEVRRRFPETFPSYALACRKRQLVPGGALYLETDAETPDGILFAVAHRGVMRELGAHVRLPGGLAAPLGGQVREDMIHRTVQAILTVMYEERLTSVAVPPVPATWRLSPGRGWLLLEPLRATPPRGCVVTFHAS